MDLQLWTFNWRDGGFNQVHAVSRQDAIDQIDAKFADKATGQRDQKWNSDNIVNLRLVNNEGEYWSSLPMFD